MNHSHISTKTNVMFNVVIIVYQITYFSGVIVNYVLSVTIINNSGPKYLIKI